MTKPFNISFLSAYDFLSTDLVVLNRRIQKLEDGEVAKIVYNESVDFEQYISHPLFTELQLDNHSSVSIEQLNWEKNRIRAWLLKRPSRNNMTLHIPLCKFVLMKAMDFSQIPYDHPDIGIVKIGSDVEGLTYTFFVEDIKAGHVKSHAMLNNLWNNHGDLIRNSMLLYMKYS